MNSSPSCPTHLVSDAPADGDALGGAHERLANAIVDVIETEAGGKAIGLEGVWGAGKSTVVGLVTRRLNDRAAEKPTHVTVFDVWAHQGDPLRRTFLENLIKDLGPDGADWLPHPEIWEQRREELAKRRREEHQQMFPRLSGRGALFALALLLMPTGIALLSIDWIPRWLGGLMAASPLIVAALVSSGIVIALKRRESSPAAQKQSRLKRITATAYNLLRHPVRGLWTETTTLVRGLGREFPTALLTAQTISETKSITIETADPTSVEFGETFRQLLDEALNDERRLVLAIDNLDRVDPEDALAIWSTLQTFLQTSDHQHPAWFERLWVLVPFARDGLARLWTRPDEQPQGEVMRSFMDKTFQVKFQIPPPALSNWSSFLRTQLDVALPAHGEADQHGVYRAVALRTHHELAKPTPRELKLFVNEIGALHRQWQDEFSLSDYACFVLLQRTGMVDTVIRAAPENLADARFAQDVIGADWHDKLAALYYNTPIPIARQILLREPIESALTQGNGKALRELAEQHPDGFWAVFEDAVPGGSGTWENVQPKEIAVAAHAVGTSGTLEAGDISQRREVLSFLESLRAAAERIDAWDPFDQETADGMVALCHLFELEAGFVANLVESISHAGVEPEGGTASDTSVPPAIWMQSVRSFIRQLNERGLAEMLADSIEVPLSAAQWMQEAPELWERDDSASVWLGHLTLAGASDLDSLLAPRTTPDQIDDAAVRVIEVSAKTRSRAAVRTLVTNAMSSLRTPETLNAAPLSLILRVVRAGRAAGLVDDATFEQLATEGHLLHHLHQAVAEGHAEAAAGLTFAFLQSAPGGSKPSQTSGNSEAGHAALMKLLRKPDELANFEEQFTALAQAAGISTLVPMLEHGEELLYRAFRRFLDEEDEATTTPDFIRKHWLLVWNTIAETRPDDSPEVATQFKDTLRRVNPLVGLVTAITGDAFDPGDSTLYLGLLNIHDSKELGEWAGRGLAGLDADRWAEALRDPDDDVANLALGLAQQSIDVTLGTDFVDGLRQYARDALGKEKPSGAAEQLPGLIGLLAQHHRSGLPTALYRVLDGAEAKAKKGFFVLFGDLITERTSLLSEPRFVERICEPMLQEGNLAGLEWLEGALRQWPDLLEAHQDKNAVLRFRDRIEGELRNVSEGESTVITRIAGILGIELPPEPEADELDGGEPESEGLPDS